MKVPLPEIAQNDPSDNLTGGLTELLGPYGYSTITATSDKPGEGHRTRQGEVLDTALHNWRVTSPKDRFTIHTRGGGADIPHKDWKTPADTRQQNREAEANQVVLNPPTKGAYMEVPVARPRANQPDPEQVEAQGRYNLGNATIDLINTVGGGLAAKGSRGSASKNLGTRGTAPEWNAPGQSVSSNVGNAKTQEAPPAPAKAPQNPQQAAKAESSAGRTVEPPQTDSGSPTVIGGGKVKIRTSKGNEEIPFAVYERRVNDAKRWVEQESASVQRGQGLYRRKEELYEQAQDRFGLQQNWQAYQNHPNLVGQRVGTQRNWKPKRRRKLLRQRKLKVVQLTNLKVVQPAKLKVLDLLIHLHLLVRRRSIQARRISLAAAKSALERRKGLRK